MRYNWYFATGFLTFGIMSIIFKDNQYTRMYPTWFEPHGVGNYKRYNFVVTLTYFLSERKYFLFLLNFHNVTALKITNKKNSRFSYSIFVLHLCTQCVFSNWVDDALHSSYRLLIRTLTPMFCIKWHNKWSNLNCKNKCEKLLKVF